MRIKHIFIVMMLFLFVFSVSAISAADNMDNIASEMDDSVSVNEDMGNIHDSTFISQDNPSILKETENATPENTNSSNSKGNSTPDENNNASDNSTQATESNTTSGNTTASNETNATTNTTNTTNNTNTTPAKPVNPLDQFNKDLKNSNLKTVYLAGDIKITKGYTLNRNLVIDGNNHVIDAQGKVRIFKTSYTLTLKNIILKNGKATDNGGAVWISNKLIIDNCTFTNNKARDYGGAIYIKNGYLEIKNSLFEKNALSSSKKSSYGGAIWTYKTNSKISKTTFKSNSCTSTALKNHKKATSYHFNGGAIYYNTGTHTLTSCVFTSNKASNHGGALFAYKNVKSVKISKSEFNKNRAVYEDGGAISFNANSLTITDSKFKGNLAFEDGGAMDSYSTTKKKIKITIKNSEFDGNTAYKGGGALWMGVKTIYSITNSKFTNNKASIAGALYIEQTTSSINKCTFSGNKAAKITSWTVKTKAGGKLNHCGGAVFIDPKNVKLTIKNSKFTKNKGTYGGALYYKGGKFTFTGNTLTSNKATKYFSCLFAAKKVTISNKNKWNKLNTKKAIKKKLISPVVKAK